MVRNWDKEEEWCWCEIGASKGRWRWERFMKERNREFQDGSIIILKYIRRDRKVSMKDVGEGNALTADNVLLFEQHCPVQNMRTQQYVRVCRKNM